MLGHVGTQNLPTLLDFDCPWLAIIVARVHNKNTKGECLTGKYPAKSLRMLGGILLQ